MDSRPAVTSSQPAPQDHQGRAITQQQLTEFRSTFETTPTNRLMQNVVTQRDVNEVALNRSIVSRRPTAFLMCWTTGR